MNSQVCSDCNQVKNLNCFGVQVRGNKAWLRKRCDSCYTIYQRNWYHKKRANNEEYQAKVKVRNKDYYSKPENRVKAIEKSKAQAKKERKENPEKYRAKARKRVAKSRKANPERVRKQAIIYTHNRRVKLKGFKLTKEVIDSVYVECNHTCVYCGKKGNTLEHLLAVNNNGTNEPTNLVIACQSCNSSKKDKFLLNFLWENKLG